MNFRFLLFPFSLFYRIAVFVRNKCFDFALLKQNKFDIPVVSIGNITTGGTGKTPHTEYLLKFLSSHLNVAVLSRGYGRTTSGFLYVSEISNSKTVGDEPLQMKNKFPQTIVAVCETRKHGIQKILKDNPQTSVVLLDDAFQHRAVKPKLSVLLLEYSMFFKTDFLLPAGNLREPFTAIKRADTIIVTKCPEALEDNERKKIINRITSYTRKNVFFTSVSYAPQIRAVFSSKKMVLTSNIATVLVTGIADASGLKTYITSITQQLEHLEFSDHHYFSTSDVKNIVEIFSTIAVENKIILTTEKDAMRLKEIELFEKMPLYYLPVEVKFHGNDKERFNKLVLQYVGKN